MMNGPNKPEANPHQPPPSPGFAALAVRISAWTTKGLLTLLVLVLGLGVGRQIVSWWRFDAAQPAADNPLTAPGDGLGDPARPHVLQFGDHAWSMRRQMVHGNKQVALGALRHTCRELTLAGAPPGDTPTVEETALLGTLAAQEPVQQEPGSWQIYVLDGALPMAAGIRQYPIRPDSEQGTKVAATAGRVVTWVVAAPTGEDVWALYAFYPDTAAITSIPGYKDVPIPPGSTKLLAVRVLGGGALATFKGPQQARKWTGFYDQWFGGHGWTAAHGWQRSGSSWAAHYTPQGTGLGGSADIHLCPDDGGEMTGLLLITPPATKPTQEGKNS